MNNPKKILLRSAVLLALLWIFPWVWQIPMLTIGTLIGYYNSPRANTPFLEAHQRAVTTFVENENFGLSRFRRSNLWNDLSVNLEEVQYNADVIQLIGLTPEKGNRYLFAKGKHTNGPQPANMTRALTEEEEAAIAKLRAKTAEWVKLKPSLGPDERETMHVIAPVWADKKCLECHEVSPGSLLGAFDYTLSAGSRSAASSSKEKAATP